MTQEISVAPDKTFVIPGAKIEQFKKFREEHNQTCQIPEWINDSTGISKYIYTFQNTGIGDNIHMVCVCGVKFYADAGDDLI